MRTRQLLLLCTVSIGTALLGACGEAKGAGTYDGNGALLGATVPHVARPNLVVILIDTLRADAVFGTPTKASSMPYFKSLHSSGVTFTRAYSPSSWTDPTLASILTGLYPREHGCLRPSNAQRISPSVVTYPEVMRNTYGYETAVFTDFLGHREQPWSVFQGFARGSTSRAFAGDAHLMEGGYGFEITNEVLDDWLSVRDATRPFCLLLHTFDAHDPYGHTNRPTRKGDFAAKEAAYQAELARVDPRAFSSSRDQVRAFFTHRPSRTRLQTELGRSYVTSVIQFLATEDTEEGGAAFAEEMRSAYLNGVRWVDSGLRSTIAALRQRNLLNNTLLVVTSDHGEAFREHITMGHGQQLHAELTHVPLWMSGPGVFSAKQTVSTPVSLLDIFPTFFELADIQRPTGVHGRSLVPAAEGQAVAHTVASEIVLDEKLGGPNANQLCLARRTDRWTYLIVFDRATGHVREHLYDARDVEERTDLLQGAFVGVRHRLPSTFCTEIERARDEVWFEIASQRSAGDLSDALARPASCDARS